MRWTLADGLVIGEATSRDALPLLALKREILDEREWFITLPEELTVTLDEQVAFVREVRDAPNSIVLVARRERGQVVGAVTLLGGVLARTRHTARLEILVSPAHRGRGIGRALMQAAIEWAEANPVLEKIGLSVFATNERAIALYRSMGFVEEGRRPREYRLEDGSWRDDLLFYRFVGQPATV